MTFTYDTSLGTDLALVRFNIGDTDSTGYFLSDEEITALLAIHGSVSSTVIPCIRYIIAKLSKPDFRADWLQVSHKEARAGYELMLKEKLKEFGVSGLAATVVQTYRHDSWQDADRDYNEDGVADD